MSEKVQTLNDIFSNSTKGESAKIRPLLESSRAVTALKEKVAEEAKGLKWPVTLDTLIDKIPRLLDVSLSDILAAAWNKYRLLRRYADREKYPPTESVLVSLAEHTIESVHRPYIEIVIDEVPWRRIDFKITAALILKGFVLKIHDGRIREIRTGSCKGNGRVTCEDLLLFERETDSLDVPGVFELGDGIPIV